MVIPNLVMGILLFIFAIIITITGYHYGKKINPFHVMIYFVASFVFFFGTLLIILFEEPPVFEF